MAPVDIDVYHESIKVLKYLQLFSKFAEYHKNAEWKDWIWLWKSWKI